MFYTNFLHHPTWQMTLRIAEKRQNARDPDRGISRYLTRPPRAAETRTGSRRLARVRCSLGVALLIAPMLLSSCCSSSKTSMRRTATKNHSRHGHGGIIGGLCGTKSGP